MEQGLQVAPTGGDDSDVARLVSTAIVERRMIELEYYKENEDEFSLRRVEPYALTNGREGWYVASFDPERDGVRHFRLDRIKRATVTERELRAPPRGRPGGRGRRLAAHRRGARPRAARACGSPPSARAGRARRAAWSRSAPTARSSSSCASPGVDWLVREVLKEAGDAAVLEPQDAREAVLRGGRHACARPYAAPAAA